MKGGRNMDIMKSFNLAIDYIEDNLTDELDEKEITRITGYSFPMFSRDVYKRQSKCHHWGNEKF